MLTHSTTLAAYRSLLKNRVDEALVILPSNAAVLVNDVLFCCPIRHGQADVTELESFDSESFDAGGWHGDRENTEQGINHPVFIAQSSCCGRDRDMAFKGHHSDARV
ncbi:hypothetical protein B0B36_18290 [Pseudomonas syringae pv. actinidifoliorum]|uniref:Uncharacterized protein n=3 Tax=Pseudomonas syringae group TaxID=136849 RepID=A0A2P0QGA4_PSESF|nr:hypothetical protein PsaNZ47_24475 [Pseudomonas syringae pv. actinidiae]KTC11612.1 hypothetical protein AO390_09535 [Pseudomonas marginalis ICMP 11289]OOK95312.1 hypothetical protein B0B36_18290 [Pseudomonas syringae pv. actinidifoliorum]ARO45414.1 hypothetical protein [Pseudomonas syringae pv. actinidiae]OKS61014.1 hypothetical protein PsaNZ62_01400 [Pseudomonas syringae pv. actinidiae]